MKSLENRNCEIKVLNETMIIKVAVCKNKDEMNANEVQRVKQ